MSNSKSTWETSFRSSLWSNDLMEKARATKFLIYILLLILSGIGNIFAVISPTVQFFNKPLTVSTEYLQAFHNNNIRDYIEELGFFDQAQKSGIIPSSQKIKMFIESQPDFSEKGVFNIERYRSFLQKYSLKEHELVDYYKKKLTLQVFKEAIKFDDQADEYHVTHKKLHFSIFLTNNSIYPNLTIDPREFREFLIRQLQKNSMYLTDSEKLAVQYIEVKNTEKIEENTVVKFYEVLKNSQNIERDCKDFFGPQSEVNIFLLPLGTKGKYHKLNFIFDRVHIKSDRTSTLFAIVKQIEARSLKDSNKIDFEFLKKLCLGQISHKLRVLKILTDPLSIKDEVYSVKNVTLDSFKNMNILRQKGLLFMKPGSIQVFKSSDMELHFATLDSVEEGNISQEHSEMCNRVLSKSLSHNFFVNSAIEYWIMRFTHENQEI
jgi:hypothetical protein